MKSKINLILLISFIIGICLPNIVFASPEDVTIYELPSLITDSEEKGYSVYRFSLKNNTNKKLVVNIELQNNNSYDNSEGYSVTKQVDLSAGESREERLFYPNNLKGNKTEVFFSVGREIVKKLSPKSGLSASSGYFYDAKHILIDRKIPNLDTNKLFRDSGLDYRIREKYKTYYFESNLDMLDREWLSYSQFDSILFYNDTFEDIPDTIRKGILDYVKVGGHLIILGELSNQNLLDEINEKKKESNFNENSNTKSSNNEVSKAIKTFNSLLKPSPRRKSLSYSSSEKGTSSSGINEDALIFYKDFGLGRITFLERDLFESLKVTIDEKKGSSSDDVDPFGAIDSKPKKKPVIDNYGKKYVPKKVLAKFDASNSDFKLNYSKDGFSSFRLAERYKSLYQAVGGSPLFLAFLVLLFALLLGPINLIILHKYKMKIMVFITVPIISILCCSILFIYFLMFEYGRLDFFRQSFTILDENSNTSYTMGGGIIVAGRNLNNELVFPLSSAVIPSVMSWRDKSLNLSMKSIKLDKVQNFTYNWIKAKSPFCYTVTTIKQDRSRLEIKESGDGLDLLNGLGADIKIVYLLSDDGKTLYVAKNIRAGANGKTEKYRNLNSRDKVVKINYSHLFSNFNERSINEALSSYAIKTLKNGEYIAWLSKDPFLKQGLEYKADVHELGCYVHGIREFGGSKCY